MDKSSELFQALVFQLAQSAYVSMGKVPSPFTGKMERNLEVARLTIDTLEAIEARTKGNLTEEETTVFERILRELRMNYLDETKRPEEKPEPESKPAAEAGKEEPEAASGESSGGAGDGGSAAGSKEPDQTQEKETPG